MLMPKRVKHRKQMKGRRRGKAWRGSTVSFGDFGLKCMIVGQINARQIEAARVCMARALRKGGKMWIRIFPAKPISKKPAETRMGGGKGNPEEWAVNVRPGTILFEMQGIPEAEIREAMRLASHKLPVKTNVVGRLI